jgi:GLPGLI family protein
MKKIFFLITLFVILNADAQKFITSGTIEYEVRTNVHKNITWDDEWAQKLKEQIPQYSVNYYNCVFSYNQAIYKFSRTGDKQKIPSWFSNNDEDNKWYCDYKNNKFVMQKTIDDYYIISGDLKDLHWKLSPNDQRNIAGFNCRKATAILYDTVYVFAYYTDEINVSGGPMTLYGLPGMILGVTIPRLYTSWVATGVKLDVPQAHTITPPTRGKKKSDAEIKNALIDLSKS